MRVLVCDLDGTLVDIRRRDYTAYVEAVTAEGLDYLGEDVFWAARREGHRIVDLLVGDADDRLRTRVLDAFVAAVEDDRLLDLDELFSDALEFLDACRGAGWRTAICTLRRRPDGVERQLQRLRLRAHVDEVTVVPETEASKADALSRWPGAMVAMIGDTEGDVRSARLAGVQIFAITTGLRSRAYLAALGPDAVADSLTELLPRFVTDRDGLSSVHGVMDP